MMQFAKKEIVRGDYMKIIPEIIRIILALAALLLMLNAAMLLRISNPTIGFLLQGLVSLFVMAYAILFNKIPKRVHFAMGGLALIPIVFVAFLFVYGNTSNVTGNEDVVIVLGAGVRGESVTRPLARRLDAAFYHWQEHPHMYIAVTGGLGSRATITEAEAMARYLVARGMPRERIILEELSTSTYENLKFAYGILAEYFPHGFSAVVVTNDFHIYRAVRTARAVGLDVTRLGAYTDWYSWPVNYLREMLAVVNFWVFG